MKKLHILLLILAIGMAGCGKSPVRIKLPALIGDNMVLQQKTTVKIWGKAAPGSKINVTTGWNAGGQAVSGKDGKWNVPVRTPEAGGPYTVTVSAADTSIIISNVLIGEVWFCSGQSNMEMPLAGWPPNDTIMYSATTVANASIPGMHLFNLQRKVAAEPTDDFTGKWEVCTPQTVAQFSATAFFFGRKINSELNIPVGLVESAWGGTPAESWMSAGVLENAGEFVSDIKAIKESIPILGEYQEWLTGHRQIELTGAEDQWKNLDFKDGSAAEPGYDDSGWPEMSLPGLFEASIGDFDGAIWFRRKVEIPEAMSGKDLILSLGLVDDMDRTYFNGKLVGSNEVTGVWQLERNYEVPGNLVKSGSNSIAVRVIDNQGGGGIYGKPGSMYLSVKGTPSLKTELDGGWKYQPAAELIGNKFYIFDLKANEFAGRKRPKTIGPYTATTLYNAMVYPAVNYAIKGAIWYQGEANVGRADQYSKIFPLMITNWRDSWQIPDFPFYFIQIAPYEYSGIDSTESAFLREAQEKALELPNTGMVVTLDIATVRNIHPPFKKEVGERLADLALSKDYGKEIKTRGPVFKSMAVDGKIARISFDNADNGLIAKDGKLTEFEVAGPDGKYLKADARIVRDEVWVTAAKISQPVSVRYCWRNGSTASLFNGDGLPAWQFRTK